MSFRDFSERIRQNCDSKVEMETSVLNKEGEPERKDLDIENEESLVTDCKRTPGAPATKGKLYLKGVFAVGGGLANPHSHTTPDGYASGMVEDIETIQWAPLRRIAAKTG